jgi:hypothetical protein
MSILFMSRIVVVVLALFVVWRLLSTMGKRASSRGLGADSYSRFSPEQRRRRAAQHRGGPEELRECAVCGTFVPRGRALSGPGEAVYCSTTCRDVDNEGSRDDQ